MKLISNDTEKQLCEIEIDKDTIITTDYRRIYHYVVGAGKQIKGITYKQGILNIADTEVQVVDDINFITKDLAIVQDRRYYNTEYKNIKVIPSYIVNRYVDVEVQVTELGATLPQGYQSTSYAESVIFNYIREYFPNALHDFYYDWLNNPMTGCNMSLDIYIPDLQIGIEYDGFGHTEETERAIQKYNDILETDKIRFLYTILEKNCVVHNSLKHKNFQLNHSTNHDLLEEDNFTLERFFADDLCRAIHKLLKELGINRTVTYLDREWNVSII